MNQSFRHIEFKDTRGNEIVLHNYPSGKEYRLKVSRKNGTDIEEFFFDDVEEAKQRYKEVVNNIIDNEDMTGLELHYE